MVAQRAAHPAGPPLETGLGIPQKPGPVSPPADLETSMQKPSIGRIVTYALNEQDAQRINATATSHNTARDGDEYPAMIVRVWDSSVNLQVFYDGVGSHWATSRSEGDEPGTWHWPARV